MSFNFDAPRSTRPSSFVGADNGPRESSLQSFGFLGDHLTADGADSALRSRELYNSLLALLQTALPASQALQRWQGLAMSMALQILRYVHDLQITSSELEKELLRNLSLVEGETFQNVEAYFHQRFLTELAERVKDPRNLSGVGLFEVATGVELHLDVPGVSCEPRDKGGIGNMALRLAHLGLLHWRVWGDIVYNQDHEDHEVEMTTWAP